MSEEIIKEEIKNVQQDTGGKVENQTKTENKKTDPEIRKWQLEFSNENFTRISFPFRNSIINRLRTMAINYTGHKQWANLCNKALEIGLDYLENNDSKHIPTKEELNNEIIKNLNETIKNLNNQILTLTEKIDRASAVNIFTNNEKAKDEQTKITKLTKKHFLVIVDDIIKNDNKISKVKIAEKIKKNQKTVSNYLKELGYYFTGKSRHDRVWKKKE